MVTIFCVPATNPDSAHASEIVHVGYTRRMEKRFFLVARKHFFAGDVEIFPPVFQIKIGKRKVFELKFFFIIIPVTEEWQGFICISFPPPGGCIEWRCRGDGLTSVFCCLDTAFENFLETLPGDLFVSLRHALGACPFALAVLFIDMVTLPT